ncbi:MAG: holo-[acyl-carrier-protein] synthase [Chloroflexota bacterium]|nr:MAG: holo-[acyl-carrier-protein] synthase [Chloroflexota bacterium]
MIEIARIEQGIARYGERFLQRFFTEQEQAFCNGRVASLAARFAAKEAVGKALGTGIGDIRWVDVEVVCDAGGKPELVLHDVAQELAQARGLTQWAISLSHTETHAIAFVVAMG